VVTDERGEEPPLTEGGRGRRDAFAPNGERGKNIPIEIQPGRSFRERDGIDLNRLYRLAPGRYSVQVTYHDEQGPTPLKLTTGAVAFTVR
jgi:hypothetical protein